MFWKRWFQRKTWQRRVKEELAMVLNRPSGDFMVWMHALPTREFEFVDRLLTDIRNEERLRQENPFNRVLFECQRCGAKKYSAWSPQDSKYLCDDCQPKPANATV